MSSESGFLAVAAAEDVMPLMKMLQLFRLFLSLPTMLRVRDTKCGVARGHLLSMPPAWDPLAYGSDVNWFAVRVIVECE